MTIVDLYTSIESGRSLGLIAASPLMIGGLALLLTLIGQKKASQGLCNLGIILALTTIIVEVFAIIYAMDHLKVDVVAEGSLVMLGLPIYLVIASVIVERVLHPGQQEGIRKRLRAGMLVVLMVGVLLYILNKLNMYMVIFSGMLGFVVFIALVIGVLYFAVRKVL